jgi:hypothetical protein
MMSMKKTVSTKPTPSNIAQITAILADTPVKLDGLSAGLSEERLRQPLGLGERSFIEDLAHLLNSEARFPEAICLALLADEPVFIDLHPERQLGKLLRFDQFSFVDLLAYFRLRRSFVLHMLASLSEAQWSRAIREEGKRRKESVYWRARSLALHELEHLLDLEHKLSQAS